MIEMTAAQAVQSGAFEGMYEWGMAVIRAFQAAGNPAVTVIARALTLFGEPIVFIVLMPVILWCVDEKRGFRLALTVFLSNATNVALKQNLQVIRPFTRDPSVGLVFEPSFSTPSGHAQNSGALYPTLLLGGAVSAGRKNNARRINAPLISLSIALPFLIGLSRIYLGAHYPTDVFLGWAIGALFSFSALVIAPALARALDRTSAIRKMRDSFAVYSQTTGRTAWSVKIALAAAVALFFNALSKGDSSMGGLLFGFITGYVLLTDKGEEFHAASGSLAAKIARLALGFAGLAVIYIGLKKALPGEGSEWYALCRFIRYGLVGFWSSFIAPRLFTKLGLA
jgi:membrane-associated phospholipid phosphatase